MKNDSRKHYAANRHPETSSPRQRAGFRALRRKGIAAHGFLPLAQKEFFENGAAAFEELPPPIRGMRWWTSYVAGRRKPRWASGSSSPGWVLAPASSTNGSNARAASTSIMAGFPEISGWNPS